MRLLNNFCLSSLLITLRTLNMIQYNITLTVCKYNFTQIPYNLSKCVLDSINLFHFTLTWVRMPTFCQQMLILVQRRQRLHWIYFHSCFLQIQFKTQNTSNLKRSFLCHIIKICSANQRSVCVHSENIIFKYHLFFLNFRHIILILVQEFLFCP